jgi:hypothetical protein
MNIISPNNLILNGNSLIQLTLNESIVVSLNLIAKINVYDGKFNIYANLIKSKNILNPNQFDSRIGNISVSLHFR